jgi:CubicO group peptidase (beta-lactamase class C family)
MLAAILLASCCLTSTGPKPLGAGHRNAGSAPDTTEIARILADRFAAYPGVGVVVGVIDSAGRSILSHGVYGKDDPRPVDGNTVFEIGSITKSFVTLLLTDMAVNGELRLDDPVQSLLPASVRVPRRGEKQITLLHLATNVSGLPDNPLEVFPTRYQDFHDGYAATEAELYELLNRHQLTRDPGEKLGHSNVGMGLLGHALARRAGVPLPKLLETRITGPLGMASTRFVATAEMKRRRASGHDAYLRPIGDLEMGALAGAGSLKSTVNDLLALVAAELGDRPGPLAKAMALQLSAARVPLGPYKMALQMVMADHPGGGEVVFTNGGTFGAQSFVGFDRARKVGFVALVNATGPARLVDDIGLHVLTGSPLKRIGPPPPPQAERHAIALAPDVLERYVGRYRLGPEEEIVVTRDGSHLLVQLPGQGPYEVFPESATEFFWKVVDAQLVFQGGSRGPAASLTMRMAGQDRSATRVP